MNEKRGKMKCDEENGTRLMELKEKKKHAERNHVDARREKVKLRYKTITGKKSPENEK